MFPCKRCTPSSIPFPSSGQPRFPFLWCFCIHSPSVQLPSPLQPVMSIHLFTVRRQVQYEASLYIECSVNCNRYSSYSEPTYQPYKCVCKLKSLFFAFWTNVPTIQAPSVNYNRSSSHSEPTHQPYKCVCKLQLLFFAFWTNVPTIQVPSVNYNHYLSYTWPTYFSTSVGLAKLLLSIVAMDYSWWSNM